MVIALDDQWIWDSWYAFDGELWHGFFLKADKALGDPDLRHTHVSVGHATSRDLRGWAHLGTCFAPAQRPAWDDFTTWTGSVVRDEAGLWHLFYTGTTRAEGGLIQRIGHATSPDLHRWERVGDGLCLDLAGPNAGHYEVAHMAGHWHDRAMRDPWVMRDPAGDGWLMFFTARVAGVAEANAGGAIGFATSPDLAHWELQPPVFAGGYGQLEVPQVIGRDGRWLCLFSTDAAHFSRARAEATPGGPVTGAHYLVAENPRGPWRVAPGFLDGAEPPRRYAARLVEGPEGLVLLGFRRCENGAFGGYVMDPEAVRFDADGGLRLAGEG